MKARQYTIRNIPEPVDRYYRKLAKISGKSLNQVLLDELAERSGANKSGSLIDSLDWFIGANTIDESTYKAWEDDDTAQKQLTRKQWQQDDS